MGYMRYHAIVVTGSHGDALERAHAEAVRLFHQPTEPFTSDHIAAVTNITPPATNAVQSFMVAPDGSKEGWVVSDRGDEARDAFIEFLESLGYSDRSSPLDWAEVQYGDDGWETKVVRDSDALLREVGYAD